MTRKIVIDIETLPCADRQQIDYLIESVTGFQAKRSKKLQQTLHRSAQRFICKTGLDGGFGRILMASVGVIGSDDIITFTSPEG